MARKRDLHAAQASLLRSSSNLSAGRPDVE